MIEPWTLPNLAALKAHVPEAEEILQKSPFPPLEPEEETPFAAPSGDILCREGISQRFYQKAKPWLDAKEGRRLFWIEDRPEQLAKLVQEEGALPFLRDPRTRIFFVETLAEREFVVKKIGWMSAFKELTILAPSWKEPIEEIHKAAQLIASDAADFGAALARHLKANFRAPIRSFAALKGSMKNIPAIVVGAGPSLDKNGPLLEALQDKALLIAAGSAIKTMKVRPHLAAALDPHEPLERTRHFDVPLCLQGRTHPKTRKSAQGPIFYMPDAHYPFEPWLTDSKPFNTGWTVGNGAVAIALELGCNPIILVGMDYCYRGKQKYAGERSQSDVSSLIKALDASGKEVLTQGDWLMAIRWMEETASAHPETSFFNATADGMRIGAPFSPLSLEAFISESSGVAQQWKSAMQNAPAIEINQERLAAWKESLNRCKSEESEAIQDALAENEIAIQLLLEPLWRIWAPMFERELMVDPHPIPMSKKLAIQKNLFFNEVIEEHLRAL